MKLRGFGKGLFQGSLILLITINIFNALNYVFHFVMARMLTAADYGILVTLMSMLYIFNISTESIQTIISKFASKEQNPGKIKNLLKRSTNKSIKLAFNLFLVFLVLSVFLSRFLRIDYGLLALSGIIIFSVFILPINRGILQGVKKFNALGYNMVLEAIFKLLMAIFLVYLGWRVYGAILAVFLGTLFAFLISFTSLKEILSSKEEKSDLKGIYGYSKPVLVFMAVIIIFYSLDVVLARRFFSDTVAGNYAIASVLAKSIFFGTQPISKAMFPIASEKGRNSKDKILLKSVLILLACIFIALLTIYFFPDILIRIFAGRYIAPAADILIYLGLAISFMSITNLVLLYKLSKGKVKNYLPILSFLVIEIALLSIFNSSLLEFSLAFMASSAIFLWGSIVFFEK